MFRNNSNVQILAVIIILLLVCVNSWSQTGSGDELSKFEKAIDEEKYSVIERELISFVIANQKHAKGFELFARLRLGQNRLREARSLFEKALSLDPNLTSAKISLAIVEYKNQNKVAAAAILDEISDHAVSTDMLRISIADAYLLVGNCSKALEVIDNIDSSFKNSTVLPIRASCHIEFGEVEKALALIPYAKLLAQSNLPILIRFTEVFSNASLHKETVELLNSIGQIISKTPKALILLAKSEIYLKEFTKAQGHLDQAEKIEGDSFEFLLTRALFETENGRAGKSLEFLEAALTKDPNSKTALTQFAMNSIRANQPSRAVKASEKLILLEAENPEFLYLHGAASLQNNNLLAAETSLGKLLAILPNDSRGCLALGLTFAAQAEKASEAREQLRKCIAFNPRNFEAKYQLGLSLKTSGETATAIKYLEDAVNDAPEYANALRDLGALYVQAGEEQKARMVLEKATKLNPDDSDTHFQLSRLYNLIGESDLAKKHLELFQKLKNSNRNGME